MLGWIREVHGGLCSLIIFEGVSTIIILSCTERVGTETYMSLPLSTWTQACTLRRGFTSAGRRLPKAGAEVCAAADAGGSARLRSTRYLGPVLHGSGSRCVRDSPNHKWAWVKIKPPRDRRFLSMSPSTRVPFWVPIFDLQPNSCDSFFFFPWFWVDPCSRLE